MRWSFAAIGALGLITVVSIISFEGGESMTLLSRGPEAEIGLPPLDMHAAGTIGTATFSLG
jgi:hypothetical protein